jgi:hypothetical protein
VKARLDRAFGDGRFLEALGGTGVQHIQLARSDHCALLVKVRPEEELPAQHGRGGRPNLFAVRTCGSDMRATRTLCNNPGMGALAVGICWQ